MQALIAVDGSDADAEAFWDWLNRERELRGHLASGTASPAPGTMGATTEFILELATIAAGASGVWSALAQSVSTWLVHRQRSSQEDIKVTITMPNGQQITIDAKRAQDLEALTEKLTAAALSEAGGR
jgi:hypothetical protein